MNEEGDVLIEDQVSKQLMWISQNNIAFDRQNNVTFKGFDQMNNQCQASLSISPEDSNEQNEIANDSNHRNNSISEGDLDQVLDSQVNEDSETPDNIEASSSVFGKNIWTPNNTLALISAIEERYEDMHHVIKRKTFWTVISNVLASENIQFTEKACQKKWFNLMRTYKATLDAKNKSGRAPTRFIFF
ncbi:hypothetical protein NQ315_013330 [Exocentrus adspersus]|uniref:Myb-like domain-containing protein n=1 Tax=Exocentrus adspersus TaxID=1586481 RepID=A0AAV8V5F5_9CUCU|nr:hypothetical protein NQ315_013330 [Exocentrus adspersus]